MIKVKVSELSGPALDWAVGKAIGWVEPIYGVGQISYITEDNFLMMASPDPDEPDDVTLVEHFNHYSQWSPSRLWSQGGPLIDKFDPDERRLPERDRYAEVWLDRSGGDVRVGRGRGPNRLIAFCRALVDAKLGAEIEIPEELLNPA